MSTRSALDILLGARMEQSTRWLDVHACGGWQLNARHVAVTSRRLTDANVLSFPFSFWPYIRYSRNEQKLKTRKNDVCCLNPKEWSF